jgi:chromosome segregation ATPase
MAANMTNNDTGFFLKTSHRFHTNAMTAYKKAWAAVWKDIEPYKLTIAVISIISTLTALLTLPLSYVYTAFIAKKTPNKDTGATGNDAKKGDKTKTAKQSDDELSKELDSVKKELEQSKKSGTESQKRVKEQDDELEKLQQELTDARNVKDSVNESNTDSEAHQQELEVIKKERDEAKTKIADLEEKVAAANNIDATADHQTELDEAMRAKDDAIAETASLREQLAGAPKQTDLEKLSAEVAALKLEISSKTEVSEEQQTMLGQAMSAKDEALAEVDRLKEQVKNAPKQAEVDKLTAEIAALKEKNAGGMFTSASSRSKSVKLNQALAAQKESHDQVLADLQANHEQALATLQATHEQALAGQEAKLQEVERDLGQKKAALESLSAAGNGAGISERGLFSELVGGSAAMQVQEQSGVANNEV